MSELRWDPLERTWALIATERGRRPQDFLPLERRMKQNEPCPFCLVLQGHGPATRIAQRKTSSDMVFVLANRFPVLQVEAPTERRQVGPYDFVSGVGAHEVVVETTHHEVPFRKLPAEQLAAVLMTWRDRVADLQRDRRFQHVEVFKNDGPTAGATLAHAHSQIVATPVRPPRLSRQLEAARAHWREKERCLVCDILAFEVEDNSRVVDHEGDFIAWCPYASKHPFEVQIASRRHAPFFAALDEARARALAELLVRMLRALDEALSGGDLNLCLSLAPSTQSFTKGRLDVEHLEQFWHWRIELVPRLLPFGGFELGTDLIINPTAPEAAAQHLRSLLR
jgi:UDPglucose--hexose-1-phosphate uridylyltransferase